ncbi:DUF5709 domain-containing protein [Streptacidiphilus monticola]|uniref:DUF5709 domain-containing protein n=1 Tax=Streptacidiphilus monticola TaxID=2161674 RepID=A0ABW1FT90_9ACTN
MSDESLMGDQVYQPDGSEVQDDEGILEREDTLVDRGLRTQLDEGWIPPDRPLAVESYGITAAEQRQGESLDQLLAHEVPDVSEDGWDGVGDCPTDGEPLDPESGDRRSGRLVSHDPALPLPEGEDGDLWASDVGISGGGASAEEAAMHIVDDPEAGYAEDDL